MTTAYYSRERNGGGHDGLLRLVGHAKLEAAIDGRWVESDDYFERIIDPGSDGPTLIDETLAGELADRHAVEL